MAARPRMRGRVAVVIATLSGLIATPSIAQETTTYSYDAQGRLIGSSISGGPANGVNAAIQYDSADNRVNYTVTGAANAPPAQSVIVLPLNGYTIIPILASQ